jgi:dethiobiotin synthetase
LQPAAAPYTAAMIEERVIDLPLIRETFASIQARHATVIVEGAGGWLVPIMREYLVRDLAVEFGLPVVVVAANRLGVINHTLLTVESILAAGIPCAGVILNQPKAPDPADTSVVTNPGILEDILALKGVPVLGEVEYGSDRLPERVLLGLEISVAGR